MSEYETISYQQVKHLEFIQGVIARMAGNSFLIKGWAITVNVAVLAYVVRNPDWRLALLALLPVVSFWWLDTFFLKRERQYRMLYDSVRQAQSAPDPFSMKVLPLARKIRIWKVAFSRSILLFHGPMILAAATLLFLDGFPQGTTWLRDIFH